MSAIAFRLKHAVIRFRSCYFVCSLPFRGFCVSFWGARPGAFFRDGMGLCGTGLGGGGAGMDGVADN